MISLKLISSSRWSRFPLKSPDIILLCPASYTLWSALQGCQQPNQETLPPQYPAVSHWTASVEQLDILMADDERFPFNYPTHTFPGRQRYTAALLQFHSPLSNWRQWILVISCLHWSAVLVQRSVCNDIIFIRTLKSLTSTHWRWAPKGGRISLAARSWTKCRTWQPKRQRSNTEKERSLWTWSPRIAWNMSSN